MSKDICKLDKKFYKKSGGRGTIFITPDEDIIKSVPVEEDQEKKWFKILRKKVRYPYIRMINLPVVSKKCDEYNYYLFEKLDGDLDQLIKSRHSLYVRKNILLQCIILIHYLNDKHQIYHNDLYWLRKIRNMMYIKIDKDFKLPYGVSAKKYLVKMIDFEWMSEGEYAWKSKKYDFIPRMEGVRESEVPIFVYSYFLNMKPKLDMSALQEELRMVWDGDFSKFIKYIKKDFNRLYKKYING